MGGFIHNNRWMNGGVWMQAGAQGWRQGKKEAEMERRAQERKEAEGGKGGRGIIQIPYLDRPETDSPPPSPAPRGTWLCYPWALSQS